MLWAHVDHHQVTVILLSLLDSFNSDSTGSLEIRQSISFVV
jgi:hypothetical protein